MEEGQLKKNMERERSEVKNIKVAIIGGGISGLYAALFLQELNLSSNSTLVFYEFTIYEKAKRLGGRIYTKVFDHTKTDLYSDMGAMRIPKSHIPVFDLIEFLNEKTGHITDEYRREHGQQHLKAIELIEYFFDSRGLPKSTTESPFPTKETLNAPSQRNHGLRYDQASCSGGGGVFREKDEAKRAPDKVLLLEKFRDSF